MLVEVRGEFLAAIRAGKDLEEILSSRPTRGLDARFGGGYLKPDSFVTVVYDSPRQYPGD